MQRHIFHMRLTCEYAEENAIADLRVEHLEEGDWKSLELGTLTPGFLIFTYAVFTCQHMFLRANATERNLLLAASHGSILIDASPDWHIEKLHVSFEGKLKSGSATQDDIDYITGRMQQCPVSKNLGQIEETLTTLQLL